MSADLDDWTVGAPRLVAQRCEACAARWLFRRDFCPQCGCQPPQPLALTGVGIVHAATVVHRAPDDEFRAIAPYALVLVELDEAVRVMGHAPLGAAIGARVEVTFVEIAGRLLPYFCPIPTATGRSDLSDLSDLSGQGDRGDRGDPGGAWTSPSSK
jgi:uncharacterized OB-fold protein